MDQLDIVYKDNYVIGINKPAGLITIPNSFTPKEATLLGMIEKYFNQKIYVLHRLDKDTSGIIIFARGKESHRFLSLEFEHKRMKKVYQGIVEGKLKQKEGKIEGGIVKDEKDFSKMKLSENANKAETTFKVLELFKNYTLIEILPLTGKRHQIRLHLNKLGHPLAIDPAYGRETPIYLSEMKRFYKLKKETEEKPIIKRVPLHAIMLEFTHPISRTKIAITAPLPKDIAYFLKVLRKYNK